MNEVEALDFVHASLVRGRTLRAFTIADLFEDQGSAMANALAAGGTSFLRNL